MDKEKKSKKKRKTDKSKLSKALGDDISECVRTYDFEGVKIVILSSITQRAIGCIVGEHVTTEEPWMFIKKEKIEDNLDLHEESSEFLPLKQCILEYPEEEMLLGYDRPLNDGQERFLLCSNTMSKDMVLNILEEQKFELQEKLKNSIIKTSRIWDSLGSETEVNENMSNNFRPLFEVEVASKYPIYTEKITFSTRLVEEAKDGYVELLPGRFPVTHLSKKRIDAAIQVAPKTTNNEAQTNPAYPKNMFSQYCYEYTQPQLNADEVKNLENFMTHRTDDLFDSIRENESINLYINDYEKMAVKVASSLFMMSHDIISFRDVIACKDKMVSDFTLDPLISGLLAASYTRAPANHIYTSKPTIDQVNETTFGQNLVLIWCYNDVLKPKLYLHSFREIVTLSYCPFKRNIIVGGCSNGQIVIWDLTNKLEQVEAREILTSDEQKHRTIMDSMMNWMKVTENVKIVMPTAVTHLDYSHTDVVSKINWILPHYIVTRNGKIIKLNNKIEREGEIENEEKEEVTEKEESMQFVSCGLDGKVLFWDMKQKSQGTDIKISQRKSQRLEKRPSELLLDISEYRSLNNTLIPHFKLTVENKNTKLLHPMTEMIIENSNLCYEAINPETKDDILKRTFFKYVPSNKPYEFSNNITVTTKLGKFLKCTWEGHEFDQGQKINYEPCNVTDFLCVHDGPIRVCIPNPIDQKCALTVGGRVFAIWDTVKPNKPLFWRKSKVKYVSGFWSHMNPCSVIVVRYDAHFETWELLQRTKTPIRIIRFPGNQILDVNSESTKLHVKKKTFATSDVVGSVRIYNVPSLVVMADHHIRQAFKIRDRIEQRKKVQQEWLESWKVRYGIETVEEHEENHEKTDLKSVIESPSIRRISSLRKKSETFDKLTSNKWHEKQEQLMYEILLQKKKLNLAEIELHKVPLQKLIEEKRNKDLKTEKILKNKEKIFDNSKKVLFKQTKIKKRKVIQISFPNEIVETMKETYIEEYKNMEKDTLKHIKFKQFRYIFDWSSMIADGRRRRNSINLHMNRVNFHYLRHKASKENFELNEHQRLSTIAENTQSATDINDQVSDEK